MVNCSRKKDNWVRLSSQHGQFSAFKGFFYKRGITHRTKLKDICNKHYYFKDKEMILEDRP